MRANYTIARNFDAYNPPKTQPVGDPLQVAATLLQSDGGTFDLRGNPVEFNHGYQVGGFEPGTKVNPVSYEDAARWVRDAFKFARSLPHTSHYVGVWIDKDGNRHLDVSRHIINHARAHYLARRNDEVAIWDWSTGSSEDTHQIA